MKTAKKTNAGVKFKWAGGSFPVPADVVGRELQRLEVRPGDFHRTSDVLDAARHPDSPLHGCFTWDDEKAAEQHRMMQARGLLRSISVVITRGEEQEVRPVYLHLRDDDGPKYVRAERVATHADAMEAALHEALTALNGFKRRFAFLTELQPVFAAVSEVRKKVKKKK